MAEYHDIIGARDDEAAQTPEFAPFAGKEGYSPVAYAPYILAAAIGRLLSLDLPELLFLMRFLGLVVFTAVRSLSTYGARHAQPRSVLLRTFRSPLLNALVLTRAL